MTPRQLQLYRYLYDRRDEPLAPSYEELVAHLGFKAKSNVSRLVDTLSALGYVERLPNMPRSLRINPHKLPPGFGDPLLPATPPPPPAPSTVEMWAIKTDHPNIEGVSVIQPLSLRFFRHELVWTGYDPTLNPRAVRVRLTIEELK